MLLGNGSANMFPLNEYTRNNKTVGSGVFCAVRVIKYPVKGK
jgi:hypothetical protein